jgi:capsular polysaccharide transport system permease protein
MDGLNIPVSEADGRFERFDRHRRPLQRPSAWRRTMRYLPIMLVVVLPTLLATIYYFCIATEQYVSEARFVVRGPEQSQPSMISSVLQGVGMGRAQDDTFAVQDYILSRDALAELVQNDGFRRIFARADIDPLSRYPAPFGYDTFEHLYKYYLRHVDVIYDSTTGVSQLVVRAFRADDAQRIAAALFAAGERLINRMNDRERENALRDARKEVALMEVRVQSVAAQIAAFRNRETLVDPNRQSVSMLQGITDLQSKLTQTKTQISELSRSSPNSPLILTAQRRAAALQGQIDDQLAHVAGSDHSLVPKITEYDDLMLQRDFADRGLSSATASLETARLDAERQLLYLDQIVQPNKADYPAYPKRFASVAVVFLTCFGTYTIGKLLVAGAREHRLV